MCKVGDIILIRNYQSEVKTTFIIAIVDKPGKIRGLSYDIICNVMFSFKNEKQKKKKLKFLIYSGKINSKDKTSIVLPKSVNKVQKSIAFI